MDSSSPNKSNISDSWPNDNEIYHTPGTSTGVVRTPESYADDGSGSSSVSTYMTGGQDTTPIMSSQQRRMVLSSSRNSLTSQTNSHTGDTPKDEVDGGCQTPTLSEVNRSTPCSNKPIYVPFTRAIGHFSNITPEFTHHFSRTEFPASVEYQVKKFSMRNCLLSLEMSRDLSPTSEANLFTATAAAIQRINNAQPADEEEKSWQENIINETDDSESDDGSEDYSLLSQTRRDSTSLCQEFNHCHLASSMRYIDEFDGDVIGGSQMSRHDLNDDIDMNFSPKACDIADGSVQDDLLFNCNISPLRHDIFRSEAEPAEGGVMDSTRVDGLTNPRPIVFEQSSVFGQSIGYNNSSGQCSSQSRSSRRLSSGLGVSRMPALCDLQENVSPTRQQQPVADNNMHVD